MELLSAPGNYQQDDQKQTHSEARKQRRKPGILSVDECLLALSALPKLVTLGLLSPAQANCMKATYQVLLSYYGAQDAAPHRRPVDQVGLRQALRANPQLANFLAGVLSDEDIADLLSSEE